MPLEVTKSFSCKLQITADVYIDYVREPSSNIPVYTITAKSDISAVDAKAKIRAFITELDAQVGA